MKERAPVVSALSGRGLRVLSKAAHEVNSLAKRLKGPDRRAGYSVKAGILNALVLIGATRVNGISADNIVGLDILTEPPTRLHIPLWVFEDDVRVEIMKEIESAHVVASLRDRLGLEQARRIRDLFPERSSRAA